MQPDVIYLAKVRIFQQITTGSVLWPRFFWMLFTLQRYEFFSKSQLALTLKIKKADVIYLAKVRIFQQITTLQYSSPQSAAMLFTLQRYEFFSKSQLAWLPEITGIRCYLPCKGTNFLANHNYIRLLAWHCLMLFTLQRYEFFSKSQHRSARPRATRRCYLPCKGTNFLANHNVISAQNFTQVDVIYLAKVRIFQQITTCSSRFHRS